MSTLWGDVMTFKVIDLTPLSLRLVSTICTGVVVTLEDVFPSQEVQGFIPLNLPSVDFYFADDFISRIEARVSFASYGRFVEQRKR